MELWRTAHVGIIDGTRDREGKYANRRKSSVCGTTSSDQRYWGGPIFATCVQSLSKIDPNEALRIFDEVYDKNSDNEKNNLSKPLALSACVAGAEPSDLEACKPRLKFVKDNPATPLSSDTLTLFQMRRCFRCICRNRHHRKRTRRSTGRPPSRKSSANSTKASV